MPTRKTLQKLHLRAGPLSLVYESGELRGLALGSSEVLRGIYVAVRDAEWGTVPAVLSDVKIETQAESFRVSYVAEHQESGIHFVWLGQIMGEADGTVTFTMNGTAQTSFWRNRIGFCVLHPLAECVGKPCLVTHADGAVESGVFPTRIAPHQPFLSVRAISHEVASGLWADVTFSGELFEMEDQRNWTDPSLKTYGTPLGLPFPAWIEAGTTINQSVTLRLRGLLTSPVPEQGDEPVQITFLDLPALPLPRIGLGVAGHGLPLTAPATARLRVLSLDHLRVDLTLSDAAYSAQLAQAASEALALGTRLLTALHLSENSEAELAALSSLIAEAGWPLGGWLIFSIYEKCTPEPLLALARRFLQQAAPESLFLGGTDAYFAELNRGRPALTGADGAVYSVNPQVHAFDDASLMETPIAQAETVRSSRHLYPDLALWVSPVTLKPRFNPDTTGPGKARTETPDSRQKSPLAAAWTVSSIKNLAEAGAAGMTYFETTGACGVMEADGGEVFPVYQALAEISTYAGGLVLPAVSSRPRRVTCLALRRGRSMSLILANMTSEPQTVRLPEQFRGEAKVLAPYSTVAVAASAAQLPHITPCR